MKKIIGSFDFSSKEDNLSVKYKNELQFDLQVYYSSEFEKADFDEHKIIFTGNIYNTDKISDFFDITHYENIAELLLKIYLKENLKAFKKVDGEYTIVIISKLETIIVRDKNGCGIPIYYNENYFSNSFTDILNLTKSKAIDKDSIKAFLNLGYIPSPNTPFINIKKMSGGSFLYHRYHVSTIEGNLFDYEDFLKGVHKSVSSNDDKNENKYEIFNTLLNEATEKRIINKEKIGLIDFQGFSKKIQKSNDFNYFLSDDSNSRIIKHHDIEILPEIISTFEIPFNDNNLIHNCIFIRKIKEANPDKLLVFEGIKYIFGTNASNINKYFKLKRLKLLFLYKVIFKLLNLSLFNKNTRILPLRILIKRIIKLYSIERGGFSKKELEKLIHNGSKKWVNNYRKSLPIKPLNFEEAYNVHNYFIDIRQCLNEIEIFQFEKICEHYNIDVSFPFLGNEIYDFIKTISLNEKAGGTVNNNKPYHNSSKNFINNLLKNTNYQSDYFLNINQASYLYDINLRKKLYNYILNADATNQLLNKKMIVSFTEKIEKEMISNKINNKSLMSLSFQFFNLLILNLWWDIFINNKKGKSLKDFY